MDLQLLCQEIRLPPEVTEEVLTLGHTMTIPPLGKLLREDQWSEGLLETRRALEQDPGGMKMLTCQLLCALECLEDYRRWNFSEQIYIDTFACFSRFVNEHMASFGCYGFDRDFWTVRQISGKLFRIGVLEYELLTENGRRVVSLHIPSDARLDMVLLRQSCEDAKCLIDRTFPDFANAPYVCGSWLLSPDLSSLLPPASKILKFQQSFRIQNTFTDEDFKEWVYGRTDIPNTDLPENTSLQRNLKAFLLSGNTFRSGEGILIADPFR